MSAPPPTRPRAHRGRTLLGALLAVAAGAACSAPGPRATAAPAAGDSVRIGIALNPTRSGMASIDEGVELAVAHLNARRGTAAPFAARRAPRQLTSAVQIAAVLRDDPAVVGVVGHPESGSTLEALPVYEDLEGGGRRAVVAVSPTASSPALSGRSRWLFRVCPTDLAASEAVARYVVDSIGARRAAVVYRNDSYGRDWTRSFGAAYRAAGGTVVQRDPYVAGATEWAAYAAYMRQQGAEVLLFPGDADDAAHAIRALRAVGAAPAFVGGDAASGLEEQAAEFAGAHYTAFFDARQATAPEARRFVDAFRARFGHVPDQRAALAYDAAMVIGQAVLERGPDRRRVRDALAAIDTSRPSAGVAGPIAFDARHDVVGRSVVVATVGAR
jgi:branched-chain amino acid transport system substrate-binding protein